MALRSLHIKGGSFIFNNGDVAILLRAANGEVGKDVQRRAYAVQKRMKRLAPVHRGELRDGIRVESHRESNQGPISKIVSDAPHTLVAELGRREVRASGAPGGGVRTRGKLTAIAKGRLVWGSDSSASPGLLTFEGKDGGLISKERVGPARGAKFMERSVDAALD